MILSETKEAISWLNQFEEDDRPFARLLLNGLVLINQQEFVRQLQELILNEAQKVPTPIALVPVREAKPNEAAQNPTSYYTPIRGKKKQMRNAKAPLLFKNSFPGSEAIVANIMTQLKRGDRQNRFVPSPSLPNLRDAHCRTVFFVDDFIGSGTRVNEFITAFSIHPTIKSWYSYGYFRYFVLTYSLTSEGEKNVLKRKNRPPAKINYVKKCPTFKQMHWTYDQTRKIEEICKKYTPTNKTDFALGYRESRGMLAFEHSVPNNTPAILWASGYGWQPLFPRRSVSPSLAKSFKLPSPKDDLEMKLNQLNQARLARNNWHLTATDTFVKIILVLSAVSNRARNVNRISDVTQLSTLEVEKILVACQNWGFINNVLQLTDYGRNELQFARKHGMLPPEKFAPRDTFYYPSKLRKA